MIALPLLTPPVALEDITHPMDRFRCERMVAVITAAECKKRHDAAHADVSGRGDRQKMMARVRAISATACRGCEVGPNVIHPKLGS